MPRANAVSRFLGDRMQTRASFHRDPLLGLEIYTAGFAASGMDDGRVRVEYMIQNRRNGRRIPADQTAERADRVKALARYAGLLRDRWPVEEITEDRWTYLAVGPVPTAD